MENGLSYSLLRMRKAFGIGVSPWVGRGHLPHNIDKFQFGGTDILSVSEQLNISARSLVCNFYSPV